MGEYQAGVVCGQLLTNGGEGLGGGDAVHNEVCRGEVQVDGCGSRNKVKELGRFGVKRGCFHGVPGDNSEVQELVLFDALDDGGVEGRVHLVPQAEGG